MLSNCFAARYGEFRSTDDLDESIEFGREMIARAPPTHPLLRDGKYSLGLRLDKKFMTASSPEDKLRNLQEALSLAEEAVAGLPENHPDMPSYFKEIAKCQLYLAPLMEDSKEAEMLAQMVLPSDFFLRAFEKTCSTPLERIDIGKLAGFLSIVLKGWNTASKVQISKLASPMSLDEQDHQTQLRGLSSNSALACTSFIALQQPEKGLEILEAGRGVMANIIMGSHADRPAVMAGDADLHASYISLRDRILRRWRSAPRTESILWVPAMHNLRS